MRHHVGLARRPRTVFSVLFGGGGGGHCSTERRGLPQNTVAAFARARVLVGCASARPVGVPAVQRGRRGHSRPLAATRGRASELFLDPAGAAESCVVRVVVRGVAVE